MQLFSTIVLNVFSHTEAKKKKIVAFWIYHNCHVHVWCLMTNHGHIFENFELNLLYIYTWLCLITWNCFVRTTTYFIGWCLKWKTTFYISQYFTHLQANQPHANTTYIEFSTKINTTLNRIWELEVREQLKHTWYELKMVGVRVLMSNVGITTLVKVWCNLVPPNIPFISFFRYFPSDWGPVNAFPSFTIQPNGPL